MRFDSLRSVVYLMYTPLITLLDKPVSAVLRLLEEVLSDLGSRGVLSMETVRRPLRHQLMPIGATTEDERRIAFYFYGYRTVLLPVLATLGFAAFVASQVHSGVTEATLGTGLLVALVTAGFTSRVAVRVFRSRIRGAEPAVDLCGYGISMFAVTTVSSLYAAFFRDWAGLAGWTLMVVILATAYGARLPEPRQHVRLPEPIPARVPS